MFIFVVNIRPARTFFKFNSLSTQLFHAWLISEFITQPDVEYGC